MKNTTQRQIILNIVQKMHSHPTAEEIYREVIKEYPAISKSTVYRNLHYLSGNGTIRSVLGSYSPERFDGKLLRHYHFSCRICGNILDVHIEYLTEIDSIVQNYYGFQVDEHLVMFKGICPKCKDKINIEDCLKNVKTPTGGDC